MDRLDLITTFVAVAELGSFVGAARKLARSPAAISRAVATLEERYGLQLLNRTTRAVALTDAGERYLQQARRFLAEHDELERAIQGERAVARGLLTIAAPVVFGRLHVLPIVTSFLAEHPLVEVELMLLDRVVSYVDEGVDLGVRIGELPDSSLKATRVGAVRRVVCASPDYLARNGEPKSLVDLTQHAIIIATGSSVQPTEWLTEDGGVRRPPKLSVNSVDAAIAAACAGVGVTRLLSYQIETAEKQGRLKRILLENISAPVPIHIVRPAGRQSSLKTMLFIEKAAGELRKRFGDEPA
ncbi:LysR family transcriptional regulator (plasmid) [Methylocystis sp. MJC1]|uniref:LysR family transcriptional regulator n=1 Tax=Methylocystis sp. MJC1 TaxID=2654282 RepID=UPI0013EA234A|nr:LysR family transcriptional regulator [Methylocystis sp. MJC1]KAF2988968.1 HTH-type transcriptional regulator PgrR [Methylocystis sp. MJC1]MBU6529266.1 LysR family transcriptional regulator [Methylocystis sp. MJC1]UZX13938.1 LysR family transcriptional regulator [Methylocystis sp. MJC1]